MATKERFHFPNTVHFRCVPHRVPSRHKEALSVGRGKAHTTLVVPVCTYFTTKRKQWVVGGGHEEPQNHYCFRVTGFWELLIPGCWVFAVSKQRQSFLGVTLLDEEVENPVALKPCQERLLHNWQQCRVQLTLPGIGQELSAATTLFTPGRKRQQESPGCRGRSKLWKSSAQHSQLDASGPPVHGCMNRSMATPSAGVSHTQQPRKVASTSLIMGHSLCI